MANHFATVEWAKSAVLYEVNIRQYTPEGTFKAFAKHLPRLKNMGIDALWLMPITPISVKERQGTLGSYYACSSYTKINEEFGTLQDFKNLIEQAHLLGLKVIIDWVANHTGYDHHWTNEHPNWYIKDIDGNFVEENGWQDVIDLDYSVVAMQQAMISSMQYWIIECDIDGFRCDMAHLVPLNFWQLARKECDAKKQIFWLAECEVMEYHNVFDTSYSWAWMHETEKYIKGERSLNDINNVLHSYTNYPPNSNKLFFTTNHDENSWTGTEYEKYGNLAKTFAVFTFTWLGMPLIYSGQEIANKSRLKFFDKDLLQFNQPLLLEKFYTSLAMVHKTDMVTKGETFILPFNNQFIMGYLRRYNNNVLLVILNLSNTDSAKVTVDHEWLNGNFCNIFSGLNFTFKSNENFELLPADYLVYCNT